MEIRNVVQEESFKFTEEKPDLLCRSDEIGQLGDIYQFCKDYHEDMVFSDDIWFVEIEKDICFMDWLYSKKGKGKDDDRARLQQYLSKAPKKSDGYESSPRIIDISLGEFGTCAFDLVSYYEIRRKILANIGNANEFITLMDSCFDKILFSDNIESPLKAIGDFELYVEEIVQMLSTLNDCGLAIFKEYHNNTKRAMEELTAKAERTCSPESRENFKYCKFSFTIEEEINNDEKREITRNILCSPHLKLIHDGSNLRIYFNWNDTEIGKGEKILVGRIGGHPYPKK